MQTFGACTIETEDRGGRAIRKTQTFVAAKHDDAERQRAHQCVETIVQRASARLSRSGGSGDACDRLNQRMRYSLKM